MTTMNERLIGQPVYATDGSHLGTVKEVRGAYFKVDAPMQPDYWLRLDACRRDGDRLVVSEHAEHYEEPDTAVRDVPAGRVSSTGTEDTETLQLREERLRVEKERERAGAVELGKRVTERTETIDVPVREEQVVIERRPVHERAAGTADLREETLDVPVERERVRADKDTVVREEVGVRKEVTERTEPVEATLRREELVVEDDADLVADGPDAPAATTDYERERTRRR